MRRADINSENYVCERIWILMHIEKSVLIPIPKNSSTKECANHRTIALISIASKKVKVKVSQWCPTLSDPMDYAVRGILQVRILDWVTFTLCRVSSQSRDWSQVSCIADRFFTCRATREAHASKVMLKILFARLQH